MRSAFSPTQGGVYTSHGQVYLHKNLLLSRPCEGVVGSGVFLMARGQLKLAVRAGKVSWCSVSERLSSAVDHGKTFALGREVLRNATAQLLDDHGGLMVTREALRGEPGD